MPYKIQNFNEELMNFIRAGSRSNEYKNLVEQVLSIIYELNLDKNSNILDIGAGKIAPISKGIIKVLPDIKVTCVDLLKNIVELEPNITWVQTDMIEDELDLGQFDALFWISPYLGEAWFDGSFENIIAKLAKNLKPNGLFMFDMFDFQSLAVGTKVENTVKRDGFANHAIFIKSSSDIYGGKRIFENGKEMDLIWKVFTDQELENIFKHAGLKLKKRLHSFGESLPDNIKQMISYQNSKRDIYIFEKN
jgi:hypothetical protein